MFAQQIFQDSKENIKSSLPSKTSTSDSRKGLRSCNLNNFKDSTNVHEKRKTFSETNSLKGSIRKKIQEKGTKSKKVQKIHLEEKENSKPKMTSHDDDEWSDIEEMHICIESDDDYGDILPKCEHIQKSDIDALFLDYCSIKCSEMTIDRSPSPLKGFSPFKNFLDFSPQLPQITAALFDDSEVYDIPLPKI